MADGKLPPVSSLSIDETGPVAYDDQRQTGMSVLLRMRFSPGHGVKVVVLPGAISVMAIEALDESQAACGHAVIEKPLNGFLITWREKSMMHGYVRHRD